MRTKDLASSYAVRGGLALDMVARGPATIDPKRMTASCVFSTPAIDRVGDRITMAGIQTANHRKNPVVSWDHFKHLTLPIGRTMDDAGNYTVVITDAEATQTTFFSQKLHEAAQVFWLIEEKIIAANSIGFDPVKAQPLHVNGRRAGLDLLIVDLLEIAWTAIGCNQEAVRSAIDKGRVICGKPLAEPIRKSLEPFAGKAPIWSKGVSLPAERTAVTADIVGGLLLKRKIPLKDVLGQLKSLDVPALRKFQIVHHLRCDPRHKDRVEAAVKTFNESDHPRGQPGNAGQFGPGGGGAGGDKPKQPAPNGGGGGDGQSRAAKIAAYAEQLKQQHGDAALAKIDEHIEKLKASNDPGAEAKIATLKEAAEHLKPAATSAPAPTPHSGLAPGKVPNRLVRYEGGKPTKIHDYKEGQQQTEEAHIPTDARPGLVRKEDGSVFALQIPKKENVVDMVTPQGFILRQAATTGFVEQVYEQYEGYVKDMGSTLQSVIEDIVNDEGEGRDDAVAAIGEAITEFRGHLAQAKAEAVELIQHELEARWPEKADDFMDDVAERVGELFDFVDTEAEAAASRLDSLYRSEGGEHDADEGPEDYDDLLSDVSDLNDRADEIWQGMANVFDEHNDAYTAESEQQHADEEEDAANLQSDLDEMDREEADKYAADFNRVSEYFEIYFDDDEGWLYQEKSFDESKHPRGQPGNAGQFGSGGGGSSGGAEGGKPTSEKPSGKPSRVERRARAVGRLATREGKRAVSFFVAAAKIAGHYEHVATEWIGKQVQRLPKPLRLPVVGVYKVSMSTYDAAQSAVAAVAKERGNTPEQVERIAKVCSVLNVIGAKAIPLTLEIAGAHGAGPWVSGFVPLGSMGYLTYSTARDPMATFRAAKKGVAAAAGKLRSTLQRDKKAWTKSDAKAGLAELLDQVKSASDPDQWMATFFAAIDEANGSVPVALKLTKLALS